MDAIAKLQDHSRLSRDSSKQPPTEIPDKAVDATLSAMKDVFRLKASARHAMELRQGRLQARSASVHLACHLVLRTHRSLYTHEATPISNRDLPKDRHSQPRGDSPQIRIRNTEDIAVQTANMDAGKRIIWPSQAECTHGRHAVRMLSFLG